MVWKGGGHSLGLSGGRAPYGSRWLLLLAPTENHHWCELPQQVVMPLPRVSTPRPTHHLPTAMTTTAALLGQTALTTGRGEAAGAKTTTPLRPETTAATIGPPHSSSKAATAAVATACSSRASPTTARRHCRRNPSSSERLLWLEGTLAGVDGSLHCSTAEVFLTPNWCCSWCTLPLSWLSGYFSVMFFVSCCERV